MVISNVAHNGHALQPGSIGSGNLVSIGKLAARLGLSQQTVRKASNDGELKTYVLSSGHRRYSIEDAMRWLGADASAGMSERKIVVYGRVSSQKQAAGFSKGNEDNDLARQLETLLSYAREQFGCSDPIVIKDVASGISFSPTARPGFDKLVEMMLTGALDGGVVLANYKDRLARFGNEIIDKIAKHHGIEIIFASDAPDKSSEEELTADLIAFTHVYSCRFYSKRSSEKRRVAPLPTVVKRILQLNNEGCSQKAIVDRLKSEGVDRDSQNRLVSRTVVAHPERKRWDQSAIGGRTAGNSFARFANDHLRIQKVESIDRKTGFIQHMALMTHFKRWCAHKIESTISNRRVFEHLTKVMAVQSKMNWRGQRIYFGISLIDLDGAGIHAKNPKP